MCFIDGSHLFSLTALKFASDTALVLSLVLRLTTGFLCTRSAISSSVGSEDSEDLVEQMDHSFSSLVGFELGTLVLRDSRSRLRDRSLLLLLS